MKVHQVRRRMAQQQTTKNHNWEHYELCHEISRENCKGRQEKWRDERSWNGKVKSAVWQVIKYITSRPKKTKGDEQGNSPYRKHKYSEKTQTRPETRSNTKRQRKEKGRTKLETKFVTASITNSIKRSAKGSVMKWLMKDDTKSGTNSLPNCTMESETKSST